MRAAAAELMHAHAGAAAEIEDEAGALVEEAAATWEVELSVPVVTLMGEVEHTERTCESAAAAHAAAKELSE